MADEADLANEHIEREAAGLIASAHKPSGPTANGLCHWCGEMIADHLRWCPDTDCRTGVAAGDARKRLQAAILRAETELVLSEQRETVPQRCPTCRYQHGHAIGCENNPVDIALRARSPTGGVSDREWSALPANLREGCTQRVPGVGDI